MDIINANISYFLSRIHSGEHVKLTSDIVGLVKEDVLTMAETQSRMEKLLEAVEHEKLLFKLSPDSPETKEIAAFDVERERAWREVTRLLKFYSTSREPAVKAAAEALLHTLKTYGDVPTISLYEETSYIDHALDDLKKPEHIPHIALISGLAGLITILENANTELNLHYIQRLRDAEEAKKLGTLGEYRKQIDVLIIDLFKILNVVYIYNEITTKDPAIKEKIQRIADNIDALFTQLKKVLHRRGVKASGGKDNPGTGEPGDGGDPGEGEGDGGDENGDGGDEGDGGETPGGDTHNPDVTNPPIPPFIPDFE